VKQQKDDGVVGWALPCAVFALHNIDRRAIKVLLLLLPRFPHKGDSSSNSISRAQKVTQAATALKTKALQTLQWQCK
jgi:hypothetical protein